MAEPTIDESWTLYRTVRNMLDFYRAELRGLKKGKIIVDKIPRGTRNRLIEYGVLRKFGSRFELTDRGMELLQLL